MYKEQQEFGLWPAVLVMAVFVMVFVLILAFHQELAEPSWLKYVLIAVLGILIFVFMNFHKLDIVIDEHSLVLRFGLFSKVINRQDIDKVSPYELKFREFGGYGIRLGFSGRSAWNTRDGKGVLVEFKNKKSPLAFNTDEPDQICRLLNSR